jgi:hypothetical protein
MGDRAETPVRGDDGPHSRYRRRQSEQSDRFLCDSGITERDRTTRHLCYLGRSLPSIRVRELAPSFVRDDLLTFTLGRLSKSAGLPHYKHRTWETPMKLAFSTAPAAPAARKRIENERPNQKNAFAISVRSAHRLAGRDPHAVPSGRPPLRPRATSNPVKDVPTTVM